MSKLLESGTLLGGYRIESMLGRGGMGVVYEATQLSLGRNVALKLLAAELTADEGFRVRFKREARIQAAIDHAHIVSIYEAGELDDEGLYIAMQIVRGPNLKELVCSGDLNPARVLRLLTPVADALDTAHQANLVHRDIKPHNILVGRRDHSYLADFGLTRRPGDTNVTRTGAFVGTLDYAAPEQIEGETPTARTDVYSFGALAFECLTGAVPFPRRTEAAVMLAHLTQAPPLASAVCADLPPAVDIALQRALAKTPGERHASALELMADLESALHDVSPYQVPRSQPSTERTANGDTLPLDDPGPATEPIEPMEPIRPSDGGAGTPSAPTRPRERVVAQVPLVPAPAGDATEMRSRAGALTREDPRPGRAAPPPESAPAASARPARVRAPRPRMRWGAVAAAAAVPIAAVLGIVIGGSGSPSPKAATAPPGSMTMGAAGMSVAVPGTWRTVDVREPTGLELRDAHGAAPPGAPAGEGIVVGRSSGSGATLLPAAFVHGLPSSPHGEAVKLGSLEAYRHANLRPSGAPPTTIYAAATTDGVPTVACVGASVRRACGAVAASLRASEGEPVALGPHDAYGESVAGALSGLASARKKALGELNAARTRRGQGKAAAAVSAAYRAARSKLLRAPVSPLERDAHARLLASLQDARAAWAAMGTAANNGDGARYSRARRQAIARESAVRKAGAALERLGYDVR